MSNTPVDKLAAIYLSLAGNHLYRYDLLTTIEACFVALVGAHEHNGSEFEDLDSLVRHVVDALGPRPSRAHWLAAHYDGEGIGDLARVHSEAKPEIFAGNVLWVPEQDLRHTTCPLECVIAIWHHSARGDVLALVPRS